MTARLIEQPNYAEAANLDQVAFWTSLPDTESLSAPAQALLRETDSDIRERRLESALDASLGLNSTEPDYLPGYIRTTELLIATRRRDHARTLLETMARHQSAYGCGDFSLQLTKLQAHVEHDVNLTLELATRIVEGHERSFLVPYVPAAIEQLLAAERHDEAIDLGTAWAELAPNSPLAISSLVRAYLSKGTGESALKTIRRFKEDHEAARRWPECTVVSALAAIASDDVEPTWAAAGEVCNGLRTRALNYEHVTDLLEFLVPATGSSQRALLLAGLFALNAGDIDEARALFHHPG
jgi:tetratricopeptide (TPR) repeat protein